jgi:transcriptional regulator with XRE-family HTH domain
MPVADDKKNPLGPIGDQVCRNVERLRTARGMTKKDLSDATGRVGRAIPPLGISRIEAGERRVDSDDLIALALALNVSPLTILLPPSASSQPTALTTDQQIAEWAAWSWATGERTASDWQVGHVVPAAVPGADPAGDLEALEAEQEFARRQSEYKALAKPEILRRRDESRVVELARDFAGVLETLIFPFRGATAGIQWSQYRAAKRLHAQLGIELEALEESLPVVHPGVPQQDG